MASSCRKDGGSRCRECQTSDAECIIGEQDDLWTISQWCALRAKED